MPFFVVFILGIFAEIYVFIEIGDTIGAGPTLLLTLLSTLLGIALLRRQGVEAIQNARHSIRSRKEPLADLFDNFCLVIAGVALVIPGFITDAIGLSLLVPAVRDFLRERFMQRMDIRATTDAAGHPYFHQESQIIEAEYTRIEDEDGKDR